MSIDFSKLVTAEDKFETAREAKLREIDHARDESLTQGFEFDGHTFDSDEKSIQRISAIATLSLMDPEFTTQYITKDNQVITLDAQQIAGLGVAAATHEAQHIFAARGLKDQAQDIEYNSEAQGKLDAIKWG